ncbi:hypothetical protein Dda_5071 [Drechslerella dactyloides]|uniref:Gfd2/YDR514C-like C-terminal domain-containing protein n=1 Tax=Drechslerella dactyloides TaxID=74499 RepID=A0AAD6NID6_DREDA|nr:hypothetical protein Dda_5071 [Drechslerella dactyloides]
MDPTSAPKYCLLKIVRRWPYRKTSKASQAVLKRFFDKEPFFDRPWDIYVAQCPESGNLEGIVVPFTQVKVFFEQTQSETDVTLSTKDRDLIFNHSGPPELVIQFIGTSQSWDSYEALSRNLTGQDYQKSVPANLRPKQARNARSEKKKQAQLQNRLNMLKSAGEIVNGKQNFAFVSIDVESWEKNHDIITEIGLSFYVSNADTQALEKTGYAIRSDHIIVKEHRFFKNGDYVADASGNFEFGKSRYVPLADLQATVASFMETARTAARGDESEAIDSSKDSSPGAVTDRQRQLALVGHDVNADIDYLKKLGYDSELNQFTMIFDTMEMWRALADTPNGISLSRLCNELDIVAWNVHNAGKRCSPGNLLPQSAHPSAGNDSRYTLDAFLAMATKYQNNLANPGSEPVGKA